jgi:hypothetical protein
LVIHDLDIVGVAAPPPEADSPLVVDPDAVLARTITSQVFQAVPWWKAQILQALRRIQHP